jgi:hypothetical protein
VITHFLRVCFKPSQSGPELVAHHVAGAAGGDRWEVVELPAIDDHGMALWPEA